MKKLSDEIVNLILVLAGVLCAGMGLKGFLFSSNFIDGGVTGVSMLLGKITSVPLYLWLPTMNLPFIALAYKEMGRAICHKVYLRYHGFISRHCLLPVPLRHSGSCLNFYLRRFFYRGRHWTRRERKRRS